MFKFLVQSYGRLLIFGLGLLAGIQVPSFINQYEQRVDAHFREVSENISDFQRTADELFAGDLDALINYYRISDDPVFTRDAASIENIVVRYRRLAVEQSRMAGSEVAVAWHILVGADEEMLAETLEQYSYTVPLDLLALQWGIILALLMILSADLGWLGCTKCASVISHRLHGKRHRSEDKVAS